jgi:hypothetical protein
MTVHHPAVHRHVVPFGWELIGAAIAGALVTLIALSAAGVRVLPAPADMPFRMSDLTLLMQRSSPATTTISPELGLLQQRHGEQGIPFLSPALVSFRAGEIAEGAVQVPTWQTYRQGEIAEGAVPATPTWTDYRAGEIAEGAVQVPTWQTYRQGEIAEGMTPVEPAWSDYRAGEIAEGTVPVPPSWSDYRQGEIDAGG